MVGETYDERAAAFITELRRKAKDRLPPDQARELVADIAEHLRIAKASYGVGNSDDVFAGLGTPDAIVQETLDQIGVSQPAPGRVARIRNARSIGPELVALTMLYLACLGANQQAVIPDMRYASKAFYFWAGITALASPILLIAGGLLICLSRRLTGLEKTVAIATVLVFPVALSQISPYLTGRNETCQSGSENDGGKIVNSYSYCLNGPNWVTHLVEWAWAMAPLLIMLTLAATAMRRNHKARPKTNPTPQLVHRH